MEPPSDKEWDLSPIFLWSGWDEKYFYMQFAYKNDCSFAGIDNDSKMCAMLKKTIVANTMLNCALILGFCLTLSTIICLVWMMFGNFFRLTNVFLLLSGLIFLGASLVWYLIEGDWDNPGAYIGHGLFFIPLAGLSELLCYVISRWYTNKLYDAEFIKTLMDSSDMHDNDNESESKLDDTSTEDSVLLSV